MYYFCFTFEPSGNELFEEAHKIDKSKFILEKPNVFCEYSITNAGITIGRKFAPLFNLADISTRNLSRLDDGYTESFNQRNFESFSNRGIGPILQLLMKILPKNSCLQEEIASEFVLYRGTVTRIIASSYDNKALSDGLKIAIVRFKGVCFVQELDTAKKRQRSNEMSLIGKKSCYAGLKLEAVIKKVEKVEDLISFYLANRAQFVNKEKRVGIFYASEIDGIENNSYVEIKCQHETLQKPRFTGFAFKEKAAKWVTQCQLSNVDQILFGFHEHFILKELKKMEVSTLKEMIGFDWQNIESIAGSFFHTIANIMNNQKEGTIFLLERQPESHFIFGKLIDEDQLEFPILSDEFKVYYLNASKYNYSFKNYGWK